MENTAVHGYKSSGYRYIHILVALVLRRYSLSLISFPDFFVGVPILDDEIVGVPTQPFSSAFA